MKDGEPEAMIRELLTGGDARGAVEATVRLYGAEVFGFLTGVMDDPDGADDVFSAWTERVFQGLGRFRGECSVRTWCYTIARNELARYRASTARHKRRNVGESLAGSVRAPSLASTPVFERTSVRDAFARLRSSLPPEDRELLVLRVDRGLSWKDLALAFLSPGASDGDLSREAARLRKRFQLIKEKLALSAAQGGLLPTRT